VTSLEEQLRRTLRPEGTFVNDPAQDGTSARILGRLEQSQRRRRRTQLGAAGVALVVAAGVAVAARGGGDLVSSGPARDTTASPTPAPDDEATARARSAYRARQQLWVECLRDHGVQVHGPDEHGDVSVDPDPALRAKQQACAALQPTLSADIEHQLQPRQAPGTQVETPLGAPVTVTRTGTGAVAIGPAPASATAVHTELTCLTAGTFTYPGGANVQCSDGDAARGDSTGGYTLTLPAGAHSLTITATDQGRWRLTAQWVRVSSVPYAVNAYGQTYGSGAGTDEGPDLIGVEAGGGRTGYVYRDELAAASGDNETLADVRRRMETGIDTRPKSIPMYESDGRTRIGTFHLG
jgi:hypothetical protein